MPENAEPAPAQNPVVSAPPEVASPSRFALLGLALLPLLIFALAFALRYPCVEKGLPYTHEWDEPFVINHAIRIMKTGDWNPHFQVYPGGYIYLQTVPATVAAMRMAGQGLIEYVSELRNDEDTLYLWTVSHPDIYRTCRQVAVLLGSLMALATFLIGRRFFNTTAGVVAGLIVACSPVAITMSATVVTDVPAALMMTVAVGFALAILQSGPRLLAPVPGCGSGHRSGRGVQV